MPYGGLYEVEPSERGTLFTYSLQKRCKLYNNSYAAFCRRKLTSKDTEHCRKGVKDDLILESIFLYYFFTLILPTHWLSYWECISVYLLNCDLKT